jgi:hypothetical protein
MRWLFFVLVLIHGLLHFMGFAKGLGFAEITQLTQPIARSMGFLWLAAGLLLLLTALLFIQSSGYWWLVGLVGVIISQVVIISSWHDAKFGTLANIIILAIVIYGFFSQGPVSFQAQYRREVNARVNPASSLRPVTEEDIKHLPAPVQRYLRLTGTIGQSRIRHFSVAWEGRIRAAAEDPWMHFRAEQHNFLAPPARFFIMAAVKGGLPVDVFHAFQENSAAMRVRLLSIIPLVNVAGPELDRSETVTFFNDLCLLAPAALIDPGIQWETIDEHRVRARYTLGQNTISAELLFNEAGELVNFMSPDRYAAAADGTQFTRQPWSTPVSHYRSFENRRVFTRGEGRWHTPAGEYTYIELTLVDLKILN